MTNHHTNCHDVLFCEERAPYEYLDGEREIVMMPDVFQSRAGHVLRGDKRIVRLLNGIWPAVRDLNHDAFVVAIARLPDCIRKHLTRAWLARHF